MGLDTRQDRCRTGFRGGVLVRTGRGCLTCLRCRCAPQPWGASGSGPPLAATHTARRVNRKRVIAVHTGARRPAPPRPVVGCSQAGANRRLERTVTSPQAEAAAQGSSRGTRVRRQKRGARGTPVAGRHISIAQATHAHWGRTRLSPREIIQTRDGASPLHRQPSTTARRATPSSTSNQRASFPCGQE